MAVEAPLTFDATGVKTAGITHGVDASQIVLTVAGDYKVTFSVSGVEPNQMALFLNGSAIAGAVYGSGAGTQPNVGQAILRAGAGDLLTLVNHSSAAAVTLQANAGGTQASVNASVLIEKLN
ncbi:MAG: collagen-like protein [Actinomycetota bacterium]|nr:collagen-like protein [Actinomycetota bacterium]